MSSSKTTRKAPGAKAIGAKSAGAKRRPATVKTVKPATKRAKPAARPAKVAKNGASVAAEMTAAAAAMEKALAAGDLASLSAEPLQKLMAAAVKAYAAKREAGESFLPLNAAAGRVTPTDIMVTSSQLLRSGNLQVFELGMWQSWTGN